MIGGLQRTVARGRHLTPRGRGAAPLVRCCAAAQTAAQPAAGRSRHHAMALACAGARCWRWGCWWCWRRQSCSRMRQGVSLRSVAMLCTRCWYIKAQLPAPSWRTWARVQSRKWPQCHSRPAAVSAVLAAQRPPSRARRMQPAPLHQPQRRARQLGPPPAVRGTAG